ncbi:MAG: hypothetical protein B6243_03975 [Anaerolineaceae bacterium 4572_5.2]|nr:MAG: hypothetical protein B6243_03975 [Anaerolineaceae bacterium 4572_5.2]
MRKNKNEMTRSKVYAIANTRGKYALQICYEEVIEEFFDILDGLSIPVNDFSKKDIEDIFDAVQYATVENFLHEIIQTMIPARNICEYKN